MASSILNSDDGVISGTSGIKSTGGDDGVLLIQTNGTTAQTVDAGQRTKFPTTIGVGGATPSTSGSGITFPATQSASSNANTLDDYEEGTWTPTANNVTVNSGSPVYVGVYTKIGNIVYVQMYQSGGNITLANDTFFGGLPFNPGGNNTSPGAWSCVGTNKSGVQYVYENTANLYVSAGISTLTNLTGFRASAVYKV